MAGIDFIHQNGTDYEIVPEIAPLFKTTQNYTAGQHVIYNAALYTFKEDKSAGVWDATKVNGPFEVAKQISDLKEDLSEIYTESAFSADDFVQGWWGASTGEYNKNVTYAICLYSYIDKNIVKITCSASYKMRLQAWDSNLSYQGIWNGSAFVKSNPRHYETTFDLMQFNKLYSDFNFKIVLFSADETTSVVPSDCENVRIFYSRIKNLKSDVDLAKNALYGEYDSAVNAVWEVGSIYQSGGNYDANDYAIRTPSANKVFLCSGTVARTTNALIGSMFLFQYDKQGVKYIGRIGTSGNTSIKVTEDGYYRFVLIKRVQDVAIDAESISLYSAGFSALPLALADIMTAVTPTGYSYHSIGKKIDLSAQGFNIKGASYSLPAPSAVHEGLESRQDFDIFNNVLFQLFSDNYVALVNIETGSVIASYAISSGHGNSCQFSNEFYDPSDNYPLLYCFGYSNNMVYVNRVTDNEATLIKTYKLNDNGFRFSGGLDSQNNRLITIHFAKNSSTDETDNYNVISVWDLNDVAVDNDDNTLIPKLIKQTIIPFFPIVQGCFWFKQALYVVSGSYSAGSNPVKLTAFDSDGNIITSITDFPDAIKRSEGEGISFYKVKDKYKCYFATYNLYELLFE